MRARATTKEDTMTTTVQERLQGWADDAAKTLTLDDAGAWCAGEDGIRYEGAVAKMRRLADDLASYLGAERASVELGIDGAGYGVYSLYASVHMEGEDFIAYAPIA
jgi:hypothetical protein